MKLSRFLIAVAGAIVLIGCGGSGVSSPSDPTTKSEFQKRVAVAVENGFRASQDSSRSGLGGGPAKLSSQEKYFDTYLEVWVQPTSDGANSDFFVDEALTEPAGSSRQTVDSTSGATETVVEVTAGPMAGFNSLLKAGFEDGVFVVRYTGGSPKTGPFYFTVTNKDGAPEFQTEYQDADGVKRTYRVRYAGDGSSVVEYNTATEFRYTLNYASDNSGTGSVTGNSPLLPATLSWDTEGAGKIVFADNSELPFVNFDFNF